MRGGSQAYLVEADDRRWYVAKFAGNPQGTRTLINEWVAYALLTHLGISTPKLRILKLSESAVGRDSLFFSIGGNRVQPHGSLHLGSECPVHPERLAIFDIWPERLFHKITNLAEFGSMFVFDKWVNQIDARQAIYTRDRKNSGHYKAHFIDHGMSFAGSQWHLGETNGHGLALQQTVYSCFNLPARAEEAVRRLETMPARALLSSVDGLPSTWFDLDDRRCLALLLEKLIKRQATMRILIGRQLRALGQAVPLGALIDRDNTVFP